MIHPLRSIPIPLLLAIAHALPAQHLTGALPPGLAANGHLLLTVSHGSAERPLDSARVDAKGHFDFGKRTYPAGFYHLVMNDTDAVDIILDPREASVQLEFSDRPLQRHIHVVRSAENQRLWAYKLVSKEAQAIEASVAQQKLGLQPTDTRALMQLDSIAGRAMQAQRTKQDAILAEAPDSYFARVLKADRVLEGAQGNGPMAVAGVFDFSDASLMRSSVYDKAVMTFLRNLNAVSEDQFVVASDTLIALAGHDPTCRAYMLDHLIDLFSTYGPDMPLQHIIDQYVVGGVGVAAIDTALQAKVREVLMVSVGAKGPDADLPTPYGPVALHSVVSAHPYTVLFFYSSTCDHCHHEMPGLKDAYLAYRSKGLEVVGIALDADSAEFLQNLQEMQTPYTCYSEFLGWGGKSCKAYQVHATPTFYVLDPRMTIVAKPVDSVDLRKWLDAHMN